MARRFVSIWFRHLLTDWLIRQHPELANVPFVIAASERGRLTLTATNIIAEKEGIWPGMALADARALLPAIEVFDHKPELSAKLLDVIGDWCIRFTPAVSVDLEEGLMLDITGCAHLFGGEKPMLMQIVKKLRAFGYDARAAMADTVGAAWAIARFGKVQPLIPTGNQKQALEALPPSALRLDPDTADRLKKLGILTIKELYALPRPTLQRRFGNGLLLRLDQALGDVQENLIFKKHIDPYSERLACPEGIATAEGIAKALEELLTRLCARLAKDQQGVRSLKFQGFRLDGKLEEVEIGTSRPSNNIRHLFKLFENKLDKIEPALGIELFILSGGHLEDIIQSQSEMLDTDRRNEALPPLIDRIANRFSRKSINRYLPRQSHWPERSIKATQSITEQPENSWPREQPRPIHLLRKPEPIQVTALVPDDPPMIFRHKGNIHRIRKADGPERIEREWWLERGQIRDYYRLEDDAGRRYWVYRDGHYDPEKPTGWYLHGFFA